MGNLLGGFGGGYSLRIFALMAIGLLQACGAGDAGSNSANSGGASGGTATPQQPVRLEETIALDVSVVATDSVNPLIYEWRATDGDIANINSPSTTWAVPVGKGLHFAYVLVSNGQGGYIERRVGVVTDGLGNAIPLNLPAPDPVNFDAPAALAANRPNAYLARSVVYANGYAISGDQYQVYSPDVLVKANFSTSSPIVPSSTSGSVQSDLRGAITFSNVPYNANYDVFCVATALAASGFKTCEAATPMLFSPSPPASYTADEAATLPNSGLFTISSSPSSIVGRLTLEDGSACGVVSEFFSKSVAGAVTLVDSGSRPVSAKFRLNRWGQFAVPGRGIATDKLKFECEGHAPLFVNASYFTEPSPESLPIPDAHQVNRSIQLTGTKAPVVTAMSVKRAGAEIGIFLPPATGVPSDIIEGSDTFLAVKGIDGVDSACEYYRLNGAASGCDAKGRPVNGITFDDWKRKFKMDPYTVNGVTEAVATFVNKVDLNLTRDHHSISYGPNSVASYVCNYLGPNNGTQAELDRVIDDAKAGKNLIACVVMDYNATPGVNNGQPYTRFMIFGPNGKLLPSINLDGRGEKFMPGVCIGCHGGDKYAGRFPPDRTGEANIGGQFLPYDISNFGFSSKAGLTKADLQTAIHDLNTLMLRTNPRAATAELIKNGWYKPNNTGTTFDEHYLPPSWQGQSAAAKNFYSKVYATSCRTCHAVFTDQYNFDNYANVANSTFRINATTCGGDRSSYFKRNGNMPNSLNTYNIFWKSLGTGAATDQVAALQAFMREVDISTSICGQHEQLPK